MTNTMIRILLLVMLAILLPLNVSAQVTLYTNNFSDPDLSAWDTGVLDCNDDISTWTVADGMLVYDEGGCLNTCTLLRYTMSSWNNYTVSFVARVVRGDQFRFLLPFQTDDHGAEVVVSNRTGDHNVCINDVQGLGGGCYTDGGDLVYVNAWNSYEISFAYGAIRVSINGRLYKSFDQSSRIPSSGTFAFLPPGTTTCNARLEVDNLVVEARPPEVVLRTSHSVAPVGGQVSLTAELTYVETNLLSPVGYSYGLLGGTYNFTMGDAPATFTLNGSSPYGSDSQSITVTPRDPEIHTFYHSPYSPVVGDPVTLHWGVTACDSVTIAPATISSTQPEGQVVVTAKEPSVYTLSLWYLGIVVDQAAVYINPRLPEILSFTASSTWVMPGDPVELTGAASEADSLVVHPGSLNFPGDVFSTIVHPIESTIYTMALHYGANLVLDTLLVSVEPPRIRSFSASPAWIQPGASAMLSWNVSYADSLRLEPFGIIFDESSGQWPVTPAVDTVYSLQFWKGAYTETAEVRVNVRHVALTTASISTTSTPRGEPVVLIWAAEPDSAVVIIDPGGYKPVTGEAFFFPMTSADYEITAAVGGVSVSQNFHVDVFDPAPDVQSLFVTAAPGDATPYLTEVAVGIPFDVYATAYNTQQAVGGFAFRLDLPPGLLQMNAEYLFGENPFGNPPDHFVLMSPCIPSGQALQLARFTLVAVTPDVLDGSVTLTPVPTLAPEVRLGMTDCSAMNWLPFGNIHGLRLGGNEPTATPVVDEPPTVKVLELLGAAPNPFNPTTTVNFRMPKAGAAEVWVVDPAGRVVAHEIVVADSPGDQAWTWRGLDQQGRRTASGVYYVSVGFEGVRATAKVTLVK